MPHIRKLPKLEGSIGWKALSAFTKLTLPLHLNLQNKSLNCDHSCDYAIIGAGYSGLSLAHRLAQLEPDAKIIVIDALGIGDGAAGRNAGFIIDVPHNLNPRTPNLEEDLMQLRLNQFAIARLEDFNAQHGVDVAWHKSGKYLVAHELKHFAHLDYFRASLDLINAPYQMLNQAELAAQLGTEYYQKGIFSPNAILMNPAALIQGIASILPKSVHLFVHSPIIEIKHTPDNIVLSGNAHKITAKKVILATNAFTEGFGYLKDKLVPVFTYASLTKPLSNTQKDKLNLTNSSAWGVTAAHSAGSTMRYTHDNRLFIRNGFDFLPSLQTSDALIKLAREQHLKSLQARFPAIAKELIDQLEYSWGGMICVTRNGQPFFGKLKDNLYALAGMNGVGVAKGTYLGYYMADYLAGIASAELDFILKQTPTWIPPDPLRYIGVKARFSLEQWQAAGEI